MQRPPTGRANRLTLSMSSDGRSSLRLYQRWLPRLLHTVSKNVLDVGRIHHDEHNSEYRKNLQITDALAADTRLPAARRDVQCAIRSRMRVVLDDRDAGAIYELETTGAAGPAGLLLTA